MMPSWVSCLGDINLSGEVNEIAESCDQEDPVCSPDEQRLLQTVGEVRMGGVDGEVSVLKKMKMVLFSFSSLLYNVPTIKSLI